MEIDKFNEFVDNDDFIIEKLIENVETDCGNCSELSIVYNHPSYIKIIEKGKKSIPFLLESVDGDFRAFWFNSLRIITGDDPDKDFIKTEDIRNSWKNWGVENGY